VLYKTRIHGVCARMRTSGRLGVLTAYERISGDYKRGINIYIAVFMEAILGMAFIVACC
jgi:hypothetical protein